MSAIGQHFSRAAVSLIDGLAWPMLWQSSLLIIVVFLIDLLLRDKLRPAVRYALWMVVLLKLLLPPSFAFPTSPAWWMRPANAKHAAPQTTTLIVRDAPARPLKSTQQAQPTAATKSKSALSFQAWLVLFSTTVSLGLFVWMTLRWRQAFLTVRSASPSPSQLERFFDETRESIRFKRAVRLKISAGCGSPAVLGLFRPTILLPESLARRLAPIQVRAVLLHELIHLRRGDVWINFAQALLQIVFWWHPLLWPVNARIRRLREEAVDDAVMFELKQEAESYPQTLLEVARLSLRRTLPTLALVGILESRHALRQRIERLVDWPVSPKAGLTLASALTILAFSAVSVPMGQPPVKPIDSPATPISVTNQWPDPRFPGYAKVSLAERFFIVESSSLDLFVPSAVRAQAPLIISSNAVAELERKLGLAGAEAFPRGEALTLMHFSGGRFHFRVGAVTNNVINYQTSTRPDGTAVVNGAECSYVVNIRPDWVALDFELVPWTQQSSVFCQVRLGVQDAADHPQEAEVTIPVGGAMLWVVTGETVPGKSELVLLKEGESAPPPDADQKAQEPNTDRLVQEAKVLFETGKLDAAEAVLRDALNSDPQNQAAYYYLNLVKEARVKWLAEASTLQQQQLPKAVTPQSGRQAILKRLQSIRLNSVGFDHLPLSEVVGLLNRKVKEQSSDNEDTNLIVYQTGQQSVASTDKSKQGDIGGVSITILPALTDVRLVDVLDAIVHVSNPPIKYSVEDYAVFFSAAVDPSKNLYLRSIKVDPGIFVNQLSRARGKPALKSNEEILWAIGDLFLAKGIDLQPPRSVSFENDRITVRATLKELDEIEQTLTALNTQRAQVNIRVKFLQVPEPTAAALWKSLNFEEVAGTNQSKLLTPAQSAVFLKAAQNKPDVDQLGSASVTTLNARQTRIECVDLRTVPVKPAIDITPNVSPDGWKINLRTIASLIAPVTMSQIIAQNSVPDGYTLLLADRVDTEAQLDDKIKNDFHDRATLLKTLETRGISYEKLRQELKDQLTISSKDRFIVLLTTTLIDPVGNRLHTDAEIQSLTR